MVDIIIKIEESLLIDQHLIKTWKQIKENGIHKLIVDNFPFLTDKKISQIIYHFKNKIYHEVKCFCCDKQVRYVDCNIGYVKYCSNSCQLKNFWDNITPNQLELRRIKLKETCISKYGVENYTQTQEYLKKCQISCLKKYGHTHHLKTENSKNNLKKNLIEKYGVDNVSKLDSIKEKKLIKSKSKTTLEKYEIREKYRKTCIEKYGVEHLSQDSDFLEKVLTKSFSYKSYRLPSGKIISLQGYEPIAMDYLLTNYNEEDIFTKNRDIENLVGKLFYKREDGIRSRYFPDIFIKSENLIIEVKSNFTYNLSLSTNLLKRNICLENGLNFNFYIIDSNSNLLIK